MNNFVWPANYTSRFAGMLQCKFKSTFTKLTEIIITNFFVTNAKLKTLIFRFQVNVVVALTTQFIATCFTSNPIPFSPSLAKKPRNYIQHYFIFKKIPLLWRSIHNSNNNNKHICNAP